MISCKKIFNVHKEIEEAAKDWQGDKPTTLPTPNYMEQKGLARMPEMDRIVWWGKYNEENIARAGLIDFVRSICPKPGERGVAIDLGCGNSLSSASLLERGWKVIFLDYSERSLAVQKKTLEDQVPYAIPNKQAEFVCTKAETYIFPKDIDVVIANNALSFFNPKELPSLIQKIYQALRPGGRFIGNFWHYEGEKGDMANKAMGAWALKGVESADILLRSAGFEVEACGFLSKSLTFCVKKGIDDGVTKPLAQICRLREFSPKNDTSNYWFYVAKNSRNGGKPYEGEALAQVDKVEERIGKESYLNKTVHGWTPLHVSVLATNSAAIPYFISKGVDPKTVDDEGLSAIDYAKRYNPELLTLLNK